MIRFQRSNSLFNNRTGLSIGGRFSWNHLKRKPQATLNATKRIEDRFKVMETKKCRMKGLREVKVTG
jgi:hypothetical protein